MVQVRPVETGTRGWFGKKPRPRIEVLAYRPEPVSVKEATADTSMRLDVVAGDAPAETDPLPRPQERDPVPETRAKDSTGTPEGMTVEPSEETEPVAPRSGGGTWRAGGLLEASGLLPQEAQRIVDRLRRDHGDVPPGAMMDELVLVKRALRKAWKDASPTAAAGGEVHVLVGAPGAGKTTCLSKWLTQVALGEGRPVRVWRLDGQTANTADALAVYCDVLGVPLARRWGDGDGADAGEMGFVDLPGTNWRDAGAVARVGELLKSLGPVRIHLVLNGAYETTLMLRQVRAFGALAVEDLLVTHLDEEGRWGKLWNLVLGTNYSVRYLSAGQNVPGDFQVATPDALWARQFRG